MLTNSVPQTSSHTHTGLGQTSGSIAPKPSCPNCGYCPHCGRSNTTVPYTYYGNPVPVWVSGTTQEFKVPTVTTTTPSSTAIASGYATRQ